MQNRIRALLVEDEFIIAMEEMQRLSECGFEITHVGSATEAMTYVGEQDRAIDLILMDVNLGEGVDGIDISYEMRKVSEVPIIFLSSSAVSDVAARAKYLTSWGYVMKGDPENLSYSILAALNALPSMHS